jgi:MSHA pilin protein MshA
MRHYGFTLIELVTVIAILGILTASALPKFINFKAEADQAVMLSMKAAIASAGKLVALKVRVAPENLNASQKRFTLDNGDKIGMRGYLARGRWNNTFEHLVDFEDFVFKTNPNINNCDDDSFKWCIRNRGASWFVGKGYATLSTGQGFLIWPFGKNANQDSCYIYYINHNDDAIPVTVQPTITGHDFSEC